MAQNDIYELIDFQNYGSSIDRIQNIHFFRQVTVAGNAEDVIDAFREDLIPDITGIQTGFIKHNRISCRNLFNVEDFASYIFDPASGFGQIGSSSEPTLPPHDVVTYRLVRTSGNIRNGYKRFTGIAESGTQGGIINDAQFIAVLETLRLALSQDIVVSVAGATFDPVVVKRIRTNPGVKPAKYRLPNTQAEAEFSQFNNVLLSLEVRTQNTRKQ